MIIGTIDAALHADEVLDRVLTFMRSEQRNAWIAGPNGVFRVYARNSRRTLHPTRAFFPMLDLATIEVHPDYQRKGIFTKFLTDLEQQVDRPLYIENILNPDLVRFLTRRKGWRIDNYRDHLEHAKELYSRNSEGWKDALGWDALTTEAQGLWIREATIRPGAMPVCMLFMR